MSLYLLNEIIDNKDECNAIATIIKNNGGFIDRKRNGNIWIRDKRGWKTYEMICQMIQGFLWCKTDNMPDKEEVEKRWLKNTWQLQMIPNLKWSMILLIRPPKEDTGVWEKAEFLEQLRTLFASTHLYMIRDGKPEPVKETPGKDLETVPDAIVILQRRP